MKTKKPEPGSKEFLDQVCHMMEFNKLTGHFWFRENISDSALRISEADGSVEVIVLGRRYPAQKLAWLMNTGEWPQRNIGFRNGINTDFRIENLFEVVTDKQLTVTKSVTLYVIHNGSEQVLTTEVLDQAVQMVRDVLEG